MAWRLIALLVSALFHGLWLMDSDVVKPLQIHGGSQELPVSVTLSMAMVEPAAKVMPQVEVSKKPIRREQVKKAVNTAVKEPKPIQAEKELVEKVTEQSTQEIMAEEPMPQLQAQASTTNPKSEAPGLESLPVIKRASFRSRPKPPVYPKLCLRKRQQGETLVQALVNADGRTQQVKLIRSSGYLLLDESALKAVEEWEFMAARVDDKPVMAWVEVPVVFKINR